jgi:NAD(P)H dehydrogenase (quinone)
MKIHVIFYSMYGHVYQMAKAVAEGAGEVDGAEVGLFQIPETLSDEVIAKMGAAETKKMFADMPIAKHEQLPDADAIIIGTPTRFGNVPAQISAFFDHTGSLWAKGALVGKVGSVFVSTNTQHGGQETTITSLWHTMIHQGMIIAGCPYTELRISTIDEITGGGPYGAGTLAGPDGSRQPSDNELAIARFQGRHVAEITKALVKGTE